MLICRFNLIPPKQRGEELKKIVKSVRDGTFEYDVKEPVKTDWAHYSESGVLGGTGCCGAALAWGVYVNFVPKPVGNRSGRSEPLAVKRRRKPVSVTH